MFCIYIDTIIFCNTTSINNKDLLSFEFNEEEINNLKTQIDDFLKTNKIELKNNLSNDKIINLLSFLENYESLMDYSTKQCEDINEIIYSYLFITPERALKLFNKIVDNIIEQKIDIESTQIYGAICSFVRDYLKSLNKEEDFFLNFVENLMKKILIVLYQSRKNNSNNYSDIIFQELILIGNLITPDSQKFYDILFKNRKYILDINNSEIEKKKYSYTVFLLIMIQSNENNKEYIQYLWEQLKISSNEYNQKYSDTKDESIKSFLEFQKFFLILFNKLNQ